MTATKVHVGASTVTRADLIRMGLVAPQGFEPLPASAPTSPASPPFPAGDGRGASLPTTPTLPNSPAAAPGVVGGRGPTALAVHRSPCFACGSTDYQRSRVRRGRLYCLDCARGER